MAGGEQEVNHRVEVDVIEAALAQLAAELGRIPNTSDWDDWGDAPCHYTHVRERFGGNWTNAIDAAGLPVVPTQASEIIRQIAYQRPGLAKDHPEASD